VEFSEEPTEEWELAYLDDDFVLGAAKRDLGYKGGDDKADKGEADHGAPEEEEEPLPETPETVEGDELLDVL